MILWYFQNWPFVKLDMSICWIKNRNLLSKFVGNKKTSNKCIHALLQLLQICTDIRLLANFKEIEEPFEKDQIGKMVFFILWNSISDIMVSLLDSSAVDLGLIPNWVRPKANKHAALRSRSRDWLAWNRDNVSDWSNMFTRWLVEQWATTIQFHVGLVQCRYQSSTLAVIRWPTASENWFGPVTFAKFFQ